MNDSIIATEIDKICTPFNQALLKNVRKRSSYKYHNLRPYSKQMKNHTQKVINCISKQNVSLDCQTKLRKIKQISYRNDNEKVVPIILETERNCNNLNKDSYGRFKFYNSASIYNDNCFEDDPIADRNVSTIGAVIKVDCSSLQDNDYCRQSVIVDFQSNMNNSKSAENQEGVQIFSVNKKLTERQSDVTSNNSWNKKGTAKLLYKTEYSNTNAKCAEPKLLRKNTSCDSVKGGAKSRTRGASVNSSKRAHSIVGSSTKSKQISKTSSDQHPPSNIKSKESRESQNSITSDKVNRNEKLRRSQSRESLKRTSDSANKKSTGKRKDSDVLKHGDGGRGSVSGNKKSHEKHSLQKHHSGSEKARRSSKKRDSVASRNSTSSHKSRLSETERRNSRKDQQRGASSSSNGAQKTDRSSVNASKNQHNQLASSKTPGNSIYFETPKISNFNGTILTAEDEQEKNNS